MVRVSSIHRYREQALDRAALIAALSTVRSDEPAGWESFAERQDVQLHELVHDFAFRGRKLIELARREQLPSAAYPMKQTVMYSRHENGGEEDLGFTAMSLWDILNRVIHSDQLAIERGHVPLHDGNLSPGQSPWGFAVASDRDVPGSSNFIFFEFFLDAFLEFDRQLERDLRFRTGDRP